MAEKKLWIIVPWPVDSTVLDYYRMGHLVVQAETEADAMALSRLTGDCRVLNVTDAPLYRKSVERVG